MDKEKTEKPVLTTQLFAEKNQQWVNMFSLLSRMVEHLHHTNLLLLQELIKQAEVGNALPTQIIDLVEKTLSNIMSRQDKLNLRTLNRIKPEPVIMPEEAPCPSCGNKIFFSSNARSVICPYCDALLEAEKDIMGTLLSKEEEKTGNKKVDSEK